ncbi:MAG: DUF2800 domain-containing protein [Archangium sp.]|nr:DUF2800 domain-containing protein [Archangium sp.]
MKLTGSSFGRAEFCKPSTFLPRIDEVLGRAGERGRAIHAFLLGCAVKGRTAALAEVKKEWQSDCAVIDLEVLPHATPDAWAIEVGLAWNWRDDSGRELFRFADSRDYSGCSVDEFPGTADVLGVTSDSVVVLDVKTGYRPLGPPAESLQLLFYAVAAARAYGKSSARIGWIRLRDGEPYFEHAFLDMFALDAAAARMVAVIEGAIEAEARFASDPSTLSPVVGPHCTFCPAFRVCPANAALMRELVGHTGDTPAPLPVLTKENVAQVYMRAKAMRKVLDVIDRGVEDFATAHPFELPNGKRVGQVGRTRETIDAVAAEPILKVLPDGDLIAKESIQVESTLTKKSLMDALERHLPIGKRKTPYMRDVMAKLKAVGAVQAGTYYCVTEFTPQKQLEPQQAERVVAETY